MLNCLAKSFQGTCASRAAFLLFAILMFCTPQVEANDGPSTAELKSMLSAKDRQFDNAKLDFVVWGEMEIDPVPTMVYSGFAKKYGWDDTEQPEMVKFRFNENLIVRGPDVTFIRSADESLPPDPELKSTFIPFQKWSNTKGLARELRRAAKKGNENAIFEIRSGGLRVDIAQEQAMEIEFAHGFGFGERIRQINDIKRDGNDLWVEGTIRIWSEDESTFRLRLDDHYIVREANIESNVHGNHTRFEVSTNGTARAENFEFARFGNFKRIGLGMEVDGQLHGKAKVLTDYKTEFQSAQINISDNDYNKLIEFDIEPGMQVNDLIVGTSFIMGKGPTELTQAIKRHVAALETSPSSPLNPVELNQAIKRHVAALDASPSTPPNYVATQITRGRQLLILVVILGCVLLLAAMWLISRVRSNKLKH